MGVWPVPPALKGPRMLTVASCEDGPNGQLLGFREVRDIEAASALVGKTLLVAASDLPKGFAAHDVPSLVGRQVYDKALGLLGTIQEVMQGAANDVWVVSGEHGEVLVPVVDEFVGTVPAYGPISVALPRGLASWEDSPC